MKPIRTALFALCLAGAGFASQAQTNTDQPTPPPGPHGWHGRGPGMDINRLTVLLDLDSYQQGQVQQALTDERNAMRTQRQNDKAAGTQPSFQEMQARRAQSEQDLIGKLSGVLNDSQITKLKVLLEPPHGPPGGATGAGTTNSTTNGTTNGATTK